MSRASLAQRLRGAHRPPADVPPQRRWWALGFILAGYASVFAAVTIMNVALPAVQTELGFSEAARQWVVTLYALSFGGLMLLGGRLADVIGLRRCFSVGMVGFAAASLLGGLAANAPVLLAARALQGATGALVAAAGLALLSVTFPDRVARARAFAVLGTVMGLGTAGSFLVAGALVDALSWRWCMLINIPIAVIVVVGLTRTAPSGTASGGARVDLFGALLVTAAMALLMIGFDRAGVLGLAHPLTLTLGAAGLVLIWGFVIAVRRSDHPLIPPRLLADRQRASAFVAVFAVGIGMFAGMFLLTTYLQDILGYSALVTGLAFIPFGISAMLTAQSLSSWARRVPPGTTLAAGLLVTAAAIATFVVLDPAAGYLGILPVMALLGAGGTIVMVTGASVATAGAGSHSGIASAMVNSSQQIGAALGTALLAAIATAATSRHQPGAGQVDGLDAVRHGYAQAGAVGGAILVVVAIVVFALTWRRRGRPAEVAAAHDETSPGSSREEPAAHPAES